MLQLTFRSDYIDFFSYFFVMLVLLMYLYCIFDKDNSYFNLKIFFFKSLKA